MTHMDKLTSEARRYLEMQVDAFKLKTVDGLAVGVSRVLVIMSALIVAAIVLAAFAFGSVILLGELIGSWAAAAFIIGGIFLIVLCVLVALRKKLFLNMFVKLFIGIFYETENENL